MWQQPSVSRRLVLLASSGIVLAACVTSDPTFVYEPSPATVPPAKMQRLLLWLPPDDDVLNGKSVSAAFTAALAPYRVIVEAGRSNRLELARSDDQKAAIENFNPTYRLEIDIVEGRSATRGSQSAMSFILRGTLYRGAGKAPLAKFHYHLKSKTPQDFVNQVVEKLKASGYL